MTTTITTSKGTFLFVGLPEGSNEHEFYFGINAPIGSIVIGKLSTLTEDQAREVVEDCPHYCKCWKNYAPEIEYFTGLEFNKKVSCWNALDSLRSLIQAERLFVENPFGNEKPKKIFHTQEWNPNRVTYEESVKQWQAAQSRTFPDWLIIKVK